MDIAKKISNASVQHKTKMLCKLMQIINNPNLTKTDAEALTKTINADTQDLNYLPNTKLALLLTQEGYDISPSAVDRHKNGTCSCRRLGK
jgi:hypothetical protein